LKEKQLLEFLKQHKRSFCDRKKNGNNFEAKREDNFHYTILLLTFKLQLY